MQFSLTRKIWSILTLVSDKDGSEDADEAMMIAKRQAREASSISYVIANKPSSARVLRSRAWTHSQNSALFSPSIRARDGASY